MEKYYLLKKPEGIGGWFIPMNVLRYINKPVRGSSATGLGFV